MYKTHGAYIKKIPHSLQVRLSRKEAPCVSKSDMVLHIRVSDRSGFTHTFFPCLYRRLPSELRHTALFCIMLFHYLPHRTATQTTL